MSLKISSVLHQSSFFSVLRFCLPVTAAYISSVEIIVTCSVVSSCQFFTFVFEERRGEGGEVNWREKWKEDCLERQTSLCLPTCKWPLCLFSWELDSSQHIRLLLPRHMWGQCIEVCIWYMTNEMVLHSRGAATAELDEVRAVESGLRAGLVVPCFCQELPLSNHCVWGIMFAH